jgi:hypothetical protein
MNTNSFNPQEDLQTIRDIMERSSRFLSLSGLSGIFAGICALIGAAVAWFVIQGGSPGDYGASPDTEIWFYLVLDTILVFITALAGAVYFSQRRAKKAGQPFWTTPTRKLLLHLMIPLAAGGFFSIILLFHDNAGLIASAMLIFYGLSLVNAGKFTLGEIHYLGLTEIVLGILAGFFTHYGLLFWSIGFGAMHIIYGAVMYYRHER